MSRILVWCSRFWPQIGGVQVLAGQLFVSLKDRGHDLAILTQWEDADRPEQDEYRGIPVYRFPFWRAIAGRDTALSQEVRGRVRALKLALRPELTHIYHIGPEVFFELRTRREVPSPILCTLHSVYPAAALRSGTVLHQLLRQASWLTAPSLAVAGQLRAAMPDLDSRLSVIHNALSTAPDRLPAAPRILPTGPSDVSHSALSRMPPAGPPVLPSAPASPPRSPAAARLASPSPESPISAGVPGAGAGPRILCLGRLVEDKGFDLAIAALDILRVEYPTVQLVIAGDGPARPALEDQVRALALAGAVAFTGWIDPAAVPALIEAATLVLVPSRCQEGFGLVALQAAQMARPVVATRMGGLPEVVLDDRTGLLVDALEPSALALAIARLLADPELAARLGHAARLRAAHLFSWDAHVDAYDALYRRLHAPRP